MFEITGLAEVSPAAQVNYSSYCFSFEVSSQGHDLFRQAYYELHSTQANYDLVGSFSSFVRTHEGLLQTFIKQEGGGTSKMDIQELGKAVTHAL